MNFDKIETTLPTYNYSYNLTNISNKSVWFSTTNNYSEEEFKFILKHAYLLDGYKLINISIIRNKVKLTFLSRELVPDDDNDFNDNRAILIEEITNLEIEYQKLMKLRKTSEAGKIGEQIDILQQKLNICPKPGDKKRKIIIRQFKNTIYVPKHQSLFCYCGYYDAIVPDCPTDNDFIKFEVHAKGSYKLG